MKLKLSELKVQSFVTSLEEEQKRTINGAGTDTPGNCTTMVYGCGSYTSHEGGTGPTVVNPATGYPCPPCNQQGGGTGPAATSQAAGCATYSMCGSGTGGTCSGMGTGYPCHVAGCQC